MDIVREIMHIDECKRCKIDLMKIYLILENQVSNFLQGFLIDMLQDYNEVI